MHALQISVDGVLLVQLALQAMKLVLSKIFIVLLGLSELLVLKTTVYNTLDFNLCKYDDCYSCIADPLCGFCDTTKQCLPGNALSPSCGTCKAWFYSDCHSK